MSVRANRKSLTATLSGPISVRGARKRRVNFGTGYVLHTLLLIHAAIIRPVQGECPTWDGSVCSGRGVCQVAWLDVDVSACACDEGYRGEACEIKTPVVQNRAIRVDSSGIASITLAIEGSAAAPSVRIATNPQHGTLYAQGAGGTAVGLPLVAGPKLGTLSLAYRPDPLFTGTDTFTVIATSADGFDSDPGSIVVTVPTLGAIGIVTGESGGLAAAVEPGQAATAFSLAPPDGEEQASLLTGFTTLAWVRVLSSDPPAVATELSSTIASPSTEKRETVALFSVADARGSVLQFRSKDGAANVLWQPHGGSAVSWDAPLSAVVADRAWHHIALLVTDTEIGILLDGIPVLRENTIEIDGQIALHGETALVLGSSATDAPVHIGLHMAHFMLWDGALDGSEVRTVLQSKNNRLLLSFSASLLAEYRFDEFTEHDGGAVPQSPARVPARLPLAAAVDILRIPSNAASFDFSLRCKTVPEPYDVSFTIDMSAAPQQGWVFGRDSGTPLPTSNTAANSFDVAVAAELTYKWGAAPPEPLTENNLLGYQRSAHPLATVGGAAGLPQGTDAIMYTCTSTGRSASAVLLLVRNNRPASTAGEAEVLENASAMIRMDKFANDPDGDMLTYYVSSTPQRGELKMLTGQALARADGDEPAHIDDAYGRLVYTPNSDVIAPAQDEFRFFASDGVDVSETHAVVITILAIDKLPEPTPTTLTVEQDTQAIVNLPGLDANGDVFSAIVTAWPQHCDIYQTDGTPIDPHSEPEIPLALWASSCSASSAYRSAGRWSCEAALGAPDVLDASGRSLFREDGRAWAPALPGDADETIQFGFDRCLYPQSIHVYQNFGPTGTFSRIRALDCASGTWRDIWAPFNEPSPTDPSTTAGVAASGAYERWSPILCNVSFATKLVEISMRKHGQSSSFYVQIDAVQLVGSVLPPAGVVASATRSLILRPHSRYHSYISPTGDYVDRNTLAISDTLRFRVKSCTVQSNDVAASISVQKMAPHLHVAGPGLALRMDGVSDTARVRLSTSASNLVRNAAGVTLQAYFLVCEDAILRDSVPLLTAESDDTSGTPCEFGLELRYDHESAQWQVGAFLRATTNQSSGARLSCSIQVPRTTTCTWQHVALSYRSRTGTLSLILDGVEEGSASRGCAEALQLCAPSALLIGGATRSAVHMAGAVDSVVFLAAPRPADLVRDIAGTGLPANDPALVAGVSFDDSLFDPATAAVQSAAGAGAASLELAGDPKDFYAGVERRGTMRGPERVISSAPMRGGGLLNVMGHAGEYIEATVQASNSDNELFVAARESNPALEPDMQGASGTLIRVSSALLALELRSLNLDNESQSGTWSTVPGTGPSTVESGDEDRASEAQIDMPLPHAQGSADTGATAWALRVLPPPSWRGKYTVTLRIVADNTHATEYTASADAEVNFIIVCKPGWALHPTDSTRCIECPQGTFSSSPDAPQCKACEPGTFASDPASTQCTSCPPGTFASTLAASTCSPCQPGTFAASAGQAECQRCPPGYAAGQTEATACTACDPFSYADTQGREACLPCPAFTRARGTSATDVTMCECDRGFYHPRGARGLACTPCPAGALCEGGSALPRPRAGFWADPTAWIAPADHVRTVMSDSDTVSRDATAARALRLPSAIATVDGLAGHHRPVTPLPLAHGVTPILLVCPDSVCTEPSDGLPTTCSHGRAGVQCRACASGWWRSAPWACARCDTTGVQAAMFPAALEAVLYALAIATAGRGSRAPVYTLLRYIQGLALIASIGDGSGQGALQPGSSWMSVAQIALFSGSAVPWSCTAPLLQLEDVTEGLQSGAITAWLRYQGSDEISYNALWSHGTVYRVIWIAALPLLVWLLAKLAIALLVIRTHVAPRLERLTARRNPSLHMQLLHTTWGRFFVSSPTEDDLQVARERATSVAVHALWLSVPGAVLYGASLLAWQTGASPAQGGGGVELRANRHFPEIIAAPSPPFLLTAIGAALCAVFGVAVPSVFAWIISHYQQASLLTNTAVKGRFHMLYIRFVPQHRYWEVACTSVFAILSLTIALLDLVPRLQITIALLLVMALLAAHVQRTPYANATLAAFEVTTLCGLALAVAARAGAVDRQVLRSLFPADESNIHTIEGLLDISAAYMPIVAVLTGLAATAVAGTRLQYSSARARDLVKVKRRFQIDSHGSFDFAVEPLVLGEWLLHASSERVQAFRHVRDAITFAAASDIGDKLSPFAMEVPFLLNVLVFGSSEQRQDLVKTIELVHQVCSEAPRNDLDLRALIDRVHAAQVCALVLRASPQERDSLGTVMADLLSFSKNEYTVRIQQHRSGLQRGVDAILRAGRRQGKRYMHTSAFTRQRRQSDIEEAAGLARAGAVSSHSQRTSAAERSASRPVSFEDAMRKAVQRYSVAQ